MDPKPPRSNFQLVKRQQLLGPIISGLRQATDKLDLSDSERRSIDSVLNKYHLEFEKNKSALKAARGRKSRQAKAFKRSQTKLMREITVKYKKKRKQKIKKSHEVSGFKKKRARLVQGGAPGLGKKK